MAASPLTELGFSTPPSPEAPAQKLADLIRLQKFAHRITSTLDLDELVPRIVDEVATSIGNVEVSLYLHHAERSELVMAAARGCIGCAVFAKGHRLKVGKEGMAGHVAATRKVHYAPDVRVDPYYIGCEESTLSEVAIPLHVEGQLVGVFSTSHHQLDAFPLEQIRLLQAQSLWQDASLAPVPATAQQVPVSVAQSSEAHSQSSPHAAPASKPPGTGQTAEQTPSTQF